MAAKRRLRRTPALVVVLGGALMLLPAAPSAEAGVLSGLMHVVAGVLEIPRAALAGTLGGPPLLGTAIGALGGTIRAVGLVAGGTLETAMSTVGLAKQFAWLAPIFF